MEGSDIKVTVNLGCEGAGAKDDFIAKYGAETKIIVLLAKRTMEPISSLI